MQFCLHYGWDSEEHARTMLSNAAHWLRPGGTLIGTTLDDETLFARLHEDEHAVSFGNECYRIEFDQRYDMGEKPFGNRYRFWLLDAVDNVPEFVVDWAMFERIAEEYGLHVIYKGRFDEILSDGYANRQLRQLLERMQVIDSNIAAAGVVTPAMPPSMWHVCTLYMGFALEKKVEATV